VWEQRREKAYGNEMPSLKDKNFKTVNKVGSYAGWLFARTVRLRCENKDERKHMEMKCRLWKIRILKLSIKLEVMRFGCLLERFAFKRLERWYWNRRQASGVRRPATWNQISLRHCNQKATHYAEQNTRPINLYKKQLQN